MEYRMAFFIHKITLSYDMLIHLSKMFNQKNGQSSSQDDKHKGGGKMKKDKIFAQI